MTLIHFCFDDHVRWSPLSWSPKIIKSVIEISVGMKKKIKWTLIESIVWKWLIQNSFNEPFKTRDQKIAFGHFDCFSFFGHFWPYVGWIPAIFLEICVGGGHFWPCHLWESNNVDISGALFVMKFSLRLLKPCKVGARDVNNKLGCVFPIVIWPAFRMEQYRVNDHPYHASQFIWMPKFTKVEVEFEKISKILCRFPSFRFLRRRLWPSCLLAAVLNRFLRSKNVKITPLDTNVWGNDATVKIFLAILVLCQFFLIKLLI